MPSGVSKLLTTSVFVIDVDGPNGRTTLDQWRTERNWRPVTLTAITGRGTHLYFRQGAHEVANSAGKLGDGIDVRGDGGYVVAPPSVHSSGHTYAWEDPGTLVADASEWLVEAVLAGKPVMAGVDASAEKDLIHEGSRNVTLFNMGCLPAGKGM